MDKVLVQGPVSDLLEKHYIPVKINLDNNRQLAHKYRVRGIPALLFLDSRGNLLKRIDGYVPGEYLVETLEGLV